MHQDQKPLIKKNLPVVKRVFFKGIPGCNFIVRSLLRVFV